MVHGEFRTFCLFQSVESEEDNDEFTKKLKGV